MPRQGSRGCAPRAVATRSVCRTPWLRTNCTSPEAGGTMKRFAYLALAVATVGTAGVIRLARGSDHQDTPEVELNPATDMTDVYAFPGASPGRSVLVLNTWA